MSKLQWLIVTVAMLITLFFSRWAFLTPYDPTYLRDLFDNSQWRVPQSTRVISDNELYQVGGRELVTRNSFFEINPEVPPVGKYIYGLSAVWCNQPYLSSLLLYVAAVALFYGLCAQMLAKSTSRFLAVMLLLLTPLFAAQVSQTMLDLPQMVWLLLHVLLMVMVIKNTTASSRTTALLITGAGISLGLFAATKIPFLAPVIVLVDGWVLWRKKQLPWLVGMGLATGVTYVFTFTGYLLTHSLGEWFTAEKWVLHFYVGSAVPTIPLMALITTFTGWYKGWWDTQGWQYVSDWSITWPLAVIASMVKLWPNLTGSTPATLAQSYLKLLVIGLTVGLALIPFWPRYFILILPFGLVMLADQLIKIPKLWPLIITIVIFQFGLFFRPTPSSMIFFATQDWNQSDYQDFYSFLSQNSQSTVTRTEFATAIKQYHQQHELTGSELELTLPRTVPWQSRTTAVATLTTRTATAAKISSQSITLLKEHNQWKIEWPASLLP